MITHKKDFLNLWSKGTLGNRLRTFPNLDELRVSGYRGPVSIRSRRPDSRYTLYHIPQERLEDQIHFLILTEKMTAEEMYFGESAPDEHLVLQGEYFDGEANGQIFDRYLMVDRQKTQMKKVLWNQRSETYSGLSSILLLQSVMDPDSCEDFRTLLRTYPNHVIEFSVYSVILGHLPHRNTLIWELRSY
jgi:hypothetical protein